MPRYKAKSAASGYLIITPIRATSPTHTTPQNNALIPPNNKIITGSKTVPQARRVIILSLRLNGLDSNI
nr:MAG TPA: hypothetical protein [Caudoviricetes sp.]